MNVTTTTDIPDCPMRQKPSSHNHQMPRLPQDHYAGPLERMELKLNQSPYAQFYLTFKIKLNQSPYAQFYLTFKTHKLKSGQTVDHLKSCPIVSCPGSLLHGLGVWVDRKLQEVMQKTISYFKNLLELKKQLLNLQLPPNACLFTTDAMSMYTNIPTHTALDLIGKYLAQHQRKCNGKYPNNMVRAGL